MINVRTPPSGIAVETRPPWRLAVIGLVILLACAMVFYRLVDLHVYNRAFLQQQSEARVLRTEPLRTHRGMILDRHGKPLAISTPVASIWADPGDLVATEAQLAQLAEILGLSPESLVSTLTAAADKQFIYLKRKLDPAMADRAMALGLPGLHVQKEYKRFYPAGEVAAHLVGFTDIDDRGQEGTELAYDQYLEGKAGELLVMRDRKGKTVRELRQVSAAEPGEDIQLSIDLRIQYLAHRELKAAVAEHGAESGSMVVIDVDTGEVLAMANQPSYNPNNRDSVPFSAMRNRAVTDLVEPGSTVKPITVAAALKTGRYTPQTLIDTHPGTMRVGRKTIRDHRDYGVIDLATVITKSSNVGTSKIALDLDDTELWDQFYDFGLGQSLGLGYPGEGVGRMPDRAGSRALGQASLAFGYGVSVTPLQLAQTYAVFASKGIKRPVSLLKTDSPPEGERVLASGVADQIDAMLESVLGDGGTGQKASIPFYRAAGKTGTVHAMGKNGYLEDTYHSIFAGYAPLDNPRVAAVVVINKPNSGRYYGGEVAAPVFSQVVGPSLRLMNVPPDEWSEIADHIDRQQQPVTVASHP